MMGVSNMSRYELSANVSLMFKEVPLLERFAAAAHAGFRSVEMWWPFESASPSDGEVDELIVAIEKAEVRLTGLNFFAGNMTAGERGIVSRLDRRAEFATNVDVVARIAKRTGCSGFNALYGQRQPGVSESEEQALAVDNLILATQRLEPLGGTILIEPLSRGLNGAYPIESASDAAVVIAAVREGSGSDNIALLFDTFHLANNDEDLVAVIREHHDLIGHVQLADAPGRGEPGTGSINFAAVFEALVERKYRGLIACEYAPTVPTEESLGWVAEFPMLHLSAGKI
jgi:hydroxypyruvate isomerase